MILDLLRGLHKDSNYEPMDFEPVDFLPEKEIVYQYGTFCIKLIIIFPLLILLSTINIIIYKIGIIFDTYYIEEILQ